MPPTVHAGNLMESFEPKLCAKWLVLVLKKTLKPLVSEAA
jgi:hypothetical protein